MADQLHPLFWDYTPDRKYPSLPLCPDQDYLDKFLHPRNLGCPLNGVVAGQGNERSIETLRSFVLTSLKRYNHSLGGCSLGLFAPSGQGKTFIVKRFAETVGLPLVLVQSSTLSDTWVLFELLRAAAQRYDIPIVPCKTEHADYQPPPLIVFFRDADAIPTHVIHSGLLRAMQPDDPYLVLVSPKDGGTHVVDCQNVCWIASAAEKENLHPGFAKRLGTSIFWAPASPDDIAQIVQRNTDQRHQAGELPLSLPQEACRLVANYHLVPRDAISFVTAMIEQAAPMPLISWHEAADRVLRRQMPLSPLSKAAFLNETATVERILSEGTHPDVEGVHGTTPMHWAAKQGNAEVLILLLARNADPNARTTTGITPLHWAVENGHIEVTRVLLAAKADPNAQDDNGSTALHLAAGNRLEIAQLLLESGANPNARDESGTTPLHVAVRAVNVELMQLLLECGADPNLTPYNGTPLLHQGIDEGHLEIVKLLLECGAKLDARSHDRFTPLHSAVANLPVREDPEEDSLPDPIAEQEREQRVELVRALLAHGADPNARSDQGRTPLHFAAGQGDIECVRLLLARGASAAAPDESGQKAMACALANDVLLGKLLCGEKLTLPEHIVTLLESSNAAIREFALLAAVHTCRRDRSIMPAVINGIKRHGYQGMFPLPCDLVSVFSWKPWADLCLLAQTDESVAWVIEELKERHSWGIEEADDDDDATFCVYHLKGIVTNNVLDRATLLRWRDPILALCGDWPNLNTLTRGFDVLDWPGEMCWDAARDMICKREEREGINEPPLWALKAVLAGEGAYTATRLVSLLREEARLFRDDRKKCESAFAKAIYLAESVDSSDVEAILINNMLQPTDYDHIACLCAKTLGEIISRMAGKDDAIDRIFRSYSGELDCWEAMSAAEENRLCNQYPDYWEKRYNYRASLARVFWFVDSPLAARKAFALFAREINPIPPRTLDPEVVADLIKVCEFNLAAETADSIGKYVPGDILRDAVEDYRRAQIIDEFLRFCDAVNANVAERAKWEEVRSRDGIAWFGLIR
jgi:cytohesin